MNYTATLLSKEMIAEGTMAFHFKKPEGFVFRAGQTIDMTLINPSETDAEGNTRTFSIAAAPSEDTLTVATRMRDTAFKRILKNAEPGLEVKINGPIGSFTLHEKAERPAVILCGGIGITPFLSIISDSLEKGSGPKIYLFYSNRRPEDAAYLETLKRLANSDSRFVFVPTMTDIEHSTEAWNGETGYITHEMITKHTPDLENAIYYIAGPQVMVTAMRDMLTKAGVSNDDIRTEEFAGY